MRPVELRAGLWRWSAAHPEWRGDAPKDSTSDWPKEVGCVLWESQEASVFIDALAPGEEDVDFWDWADAHCAGRTVAALTTIGYHRRSRDALVARYGAATSRSRGTLPAGVRSIPLQGAGERVFWLQAQRALVVGDRVIGVEGGKLRVCPQSWLDYLPSGMTVAGLRDLLRPLLELPIELVLVSHGEPVLAGGHRALARALS